ncbi:MAG: hypothetical protein C0601_09075 [Candidatus Muiribacterium halophilum]|uniref:Uncharacterized protein n=1 Tax=Muiribacterium halophilum TaxID=2053465 RepID=A0A2N5ZDX5_MUIH1|nr:MAG: hypothetical protein C0601_09075 [Candidatus Muirbacterium halophilum]
MVNLDMSIVDKVVGKIKGSADKIPTVGEVIPPKNKIKDEPELSKAEKAYSMSKLAYKSKDYRTAMRHARDTIINNKKLSGPYLIIADCYMDNKMYLNALRVVNKGIEAIGVFDLYEKIEEVYEAQGKRKEIRKMWDNYIMSSRKKDLGYKALGLFYEEKEKDPEMAIQYYKKTLEANPVHIEIYERLATLYFRTGQMQNAINVYDDLLFSKHAKEFFRNSTNKSRILTRVGEIYFLKRQFDFAFKYFDMALQAVPGNKDVYNRLGDIAYYLQDKKNTLKYYKLAYQADETDIEFIIKHAISNILNDNIEEALPLFKRIQRYNPLITGIKQIVETLEEKNEINDKFFRILVEENTDLLIDYRYEKDFKFPESREELDDFRNKYNSIDAKLDFDDEGEVPYKKEAKAIEEKNGEKVIKVKDKLSKKEIERDKKMKMVEKVEMQGESTEPTFETTEDEPKASDSNFLDEISKLNQEMEEELITKIEPLEKEIGYVIENTQEEQTLEENIEDESVFEAKKKQDDESMQESEAVVEQPTNLESQTVETQQEQKIEKDSMFEKTQIESVSISPEEIKELLTNIQNFINDVQGISHRVLQINNIMQDGNLPEDNIKRNIIKFALENIETNLQDNDVKRIREGISKLKKKLG